MRHPFIGAQCLAAHAAERHANLARPDRAAYVLARRRVIAEQMAAVRAAVQRRAENHQQPQYIDSYA